MPIRQVPTVKPVAAAAPQTNLVVGPAHDRHEREADRVAERVARTPAVRRPQHLASGAAGGPTAQGGTSGRPLPGPLRAGFERSFGADFGEVRVHAGGQALQMSRDLNAQAFTVGADVFFGAGKYAPGTPAGNRLLAHELTHVVQQRDAGAPGPRIQRKLSWQNTQWEKATSARASKGGGRGVVFAREAAQDEPVVVKSGEDAPAEVIVAANLNALGRGVGGWTIDVPGVRVVDTPEGRRIKGVLTPLTWGEPDNVLKQRAQTILRDVTKPGTMVFDYAGGSEYHELLRAGPHTQPKALSGRRLPTNSPLRLFKDQGFVRSLGRIVVFDTFLGNFDRLAGTFNPENFLLDNGTIRLIDNVRFANEMPLTTFQKAGVQVTSDQAYQAWKQGKWPRMLRAGDFGTMATDLLENISDTLELVYHVTGADRPIVRAALFRRLDDLAQGLHDGMAMLFKSGEFSHFFDQITAGVDPNTVAEVQQSLRQRRAWLLTNFQ